MYQLPGKNIALVFSDTAGANSCVALAKICEMEKGLSPLLFSNKNCPAAGDQLVVSDSVPAFKSLEVDCVFTGTSHPESSHFFEVNCIREAVGRKIYTISFIDHWVNFKLRFDGLDESEYPDEIWVVDEAAKQLAISEGLPANKIRVSDNPYHYYLRKYWRSLYTGKEYLRSLNINEEGPHILFAPDPLSIRKGKEIAGFDEEVVLMDLLSIISKLKQRIKLIIKCHPLQPVDNLQRLIRRHNCSDCFLIKDADSLELINASNLVIGFYSNMLLEAEVLNRKVIRYFPGNPDADLLRHKTEMCRIDSKEELMQQIKKSIHG